MTSKKFFAGVGKKALKIVIEKIIADDPKNTGLFIEPSLESFWSCVLKLMTSPGTEQLMIFEFYIR